MASKNDAAAKAVNAVAGTSAAVQYNGMMMDVPLTVTFVAGQLFNKKHHPTMATTSKEEDDTRPPTVVVHKCGVKFLPLELNCEIFEFLDVPKQQRLVNALSEGIRRRFGADNRMDAKWSIWKCKFNAYLQEFDCDPGTRALLARYSASCARVVEWLGEKIAWAENMCVNKENYAYLHSETWEIDGHNHINAVNIGEQRRQLQTRLPRRMERIKQAIDAPTAVPPSFHQCAIAQLQEWLLQCGDQLVFVDARYYAINDLRARWHMVRTELDNRVWIEMGKTNWTNSPK